MTPTPCQFCGWQTSSFRALKEHWETCSKRWWNQLKQLNPRHFKDFHKARVRRPSPIAGTEDLPNWAEDGDGVRLLKAIEFEDAMLNEADFVMPDGAADLKR